MTPDRTPAQAELSEGDKLTAEDVVDEIRDGLGGVDRVYALKRADAHALVASFAAQETAALRDKVAAWGVAYERASSERDAATTELAHVRVELVACQAERDEALARVRELTETLLALVNRP